MLRAKGAVRNDFSFCHSKGTLEVSGSRDSHVLNVADLGTNI